VRIECAEMKFLFSGDLLGAVRRRRGGLHQRECRVGKLLPDRKVFRRNGEPAEGEHVPARLGHASHLLPTDPIDQLFLPLGPATPSGRATAVRGSMPAASKPSRARNSKASSCKAKVARASFKLSSSSARASCLGSMMNFARGPANSPPALTGGAIQTANSINGSRRRRRACTFNRGRVFGVSSLLGHGQLQHGHALSFRQ